MNEEMKKFLLNKNEKNCKIETKWILSGSLLDESEDSRVLSISDFLH